MIYNGNPKRKYGYRPNKSDTTKRGALKIKEFDEDVSSEVEKGTRFVLYVEHSEVLAKLDAFRNFATRKYRRDVEHVMIIRKKLSKIAPEDMSPENVVETLTNDLRNVYKEFLEKYPNAIIDKCYAFNHAIDYSEKTRKAEFMSIAIVNINGELCRTQISPIISITEEQYKSMLGQVDTEEGKRLHEIINERILGNEMYGITGYLSNSKYPQANLWVENLHDLDLCYRNGIKLRSRTLKYNKYYSTTEKYLESLKPLEQILKNREEKRLQKLEAEEDDML